MKKKKSKAKYVIGAIIIITVAGVFVIRSRTATVQTGAQVTQTLSLQKTDLTKSISVSGVVKSADTSYVYSTQAYPVQEILVSVGDVVKAGDVLARLDMSKLNNDIAQAEESYANAIATAAEEKKSMANNITNATISLDSSRISLEKQQLNTANAEKDLKEAEEKLNEPFDSYSYDINIEETRIALERKLEDLNDAQEDLRKAREEFDDYAYRKNIEDAQVRLERRQDELAKVEEDVKAVFDDYAYRTRITETKTLLERRLADLEDAEKKLQDEKNKKPESFDRYAYQNKIDEAEKNYVRRQEDLTTAQANYYKAYQDYAGAYGHPELEQAAKAKIDSSLAAMENASRAVEDASTALEKARTDMQRAEEDYADKGKDSKSDILEAAQKNVDNAKKAVDDAQFNHDKALTDLNRALSDNNKALSDKLTTAKNAVEDAQKAYDKAQTDLERAQKDALTATTESLEKVQMLVADARRSHEKALNDKERAIDDYIEQNTKKLETAQKALEDNKMQLESTKNSVKSAEISLNQAKSKTDTTDTNIRLKELTLEKLTSQLSESEIVATADGVITELYAKVGATPSGVMFVIEDVDNLYVSANVKEYNLVSVNLDQKALVSTDATGDNVYDAYVSYISPKAVSPAGSTSVEFEVQASLKEFNPAIKIGMNAFLNIITETKTDVFTVPLMSIVTNENGSFVYSLDGETINEIPVTVGLKTSTTAEISGDGLYEGINLLSYPEIRNAKAPNRGGMFMGGGN